MLSDSCQIWSKRSQKDQNKHSEIWDHLLETHCLEIFALFFQTGLLKNHLSWKDFLRNHLGFWFWTKLKLMISKHMSFAGTIFVSISCICCFKEPFKIMSLCWKLLALDQVANTLRPRSACRAEALRALRARSATPRPRPTKAADRIAGRSVLSTGPMGWRTWPKNGRKKKVTKTSTDTEQMNQLQLFGHWVAAETWAVYLWNSLKLWELHGTSSQRLRFFTVKNPGFFGSKPAAGSFKQLIEMHRAPGIKVLELTCCQPPKQAWQLKSWRGPWDGKLLITLQLVFLKRLFDPFWTPFCKADEKNTPTGEWNYQFCSPHTRERLRNSIRCHDAWLLPPQSCNLSQL